MENVPTFTPDPDLKLMNQVRQVLRYHHYAITTERTYCKWILRFIHYTHAIRKDIRSLTGPLDSLRSGSGADR